ncbi:sulfotransferase family protein [Kushneria sinocarnis]|uniref:Sulfotransferase family protein n=1 Tax=Kushneria sinocarnis TaxID=595502 RepID=A0A420WTH4_9GAMM|nr:sulfotransferase [Kushneria sinocarnis]RKQ96838.1 sulfotransferase family protein [Kushneria sinocarnis]
MTAFETARTPSRGLTAKRRERARQLTGELARGAGWALSGGWQLLRQDHAAALSDAARIVRGVQPARESMQSYRLVDRLLARSGPALADWCPDAQSPARFVFFVGYSRSGHSLVGSLLDAHPAVVIAHEMHALKHFHHGHDFERVVRAIKLNAMLFDYLGREYTGYDYQVPNQYQGRYEQLTVAGDKKGNGTLRLLRRHPELIDRLDSLLPVPFEFIHVIRNPWDNIATRARRTHTSLDAAARGYFANTDLMAQLKARYPDRVRDVYLDDLIADPRRELRALLEALGCTPVSDRYLDDCASIVFQKPSRTGDQVSWPPELADEVEGYLSRHDFLRRFAAGEQTSTSRQPGRAGAEP